jgi:DNA-binding FadR family transcriptional regulator
MASVDFTPVARQSVSDTVLAQLRDAILGGSYQPGDQLPPERELAQAFAVNRHAVREAVKRLQEAGFVQVVHGGGTRVLDVRRTAGLDLLGHLARAQDGGFDQLVRDGLEMRRCIGVEAARLAAKRADTAQRRAIVAAAERYGDPTDESADRDFWALVVDASDNLAFRLALNSLVESIDAQPDLMDVLLAADRRDESSHADLAAAIASRDPERAAACADAVLSQALAVHETEQRRRRRRGSRSA